ncbi:winged helix-turn-helix domain-containing protein [Methylomonas sp. MgM2]
MNKINSIAIISNEEYIIGLLKAYCFYNDIRIVSTHTNMSGFVELQRNTPDMVFFSMDLLESVSKSISGPFFNIKRLNGDVVFIGLNKTSNGDFCTKPEWVHEMLQYPLDVAHIDNLIKRHFSVLPPRVEERRHRERRNGERRSFNERRGHKLFGSTNRNPSLQFQAYKTDESVYEQDLNIDHNNRCVYLTGHKIDLTPKEYELIELLSSDLNRIYTADEILSRIWPENDRATKSDLYQYMHLLRKKIEKDPNDPKWIITIKGFGYKLNTHKCDIADCDHVYQ